MRNTGCFKENVTLIKILKYYLFGMCPVTFGITILCGTIVEEENEKEI